jgi:tetratricopeptide (TPR) repeat protein
MAKKNKKSQRKRKPKSNSLRPKRQKAPNTLAEFLATWRTALMLFCLVGLVFLIYANSLHGPFVFDDMRNIEYNSHIRLTQLTFDGLRKAGFDSYSSSRPIANISFALNYYFNGKDTFGYHLVNTLIHATAGIFLYFFIKTTLSLPALRSRYEMQKWIAFITALIWLVHPLNTQSVTYIVQRMNSMAAMFYIMALFFYAKGRLAQVKNRRWLWLGGCAMAGILSFGSKQTAATLPFFIFLYEWYFFQDLSWSWLKRNILPVAGVLFLFGVLALLYMGVHPLERILNGYNGRDFTLLQRVLTEFRVVIFYISLLMFPHPSRLNLDRDFSLSHSLIDPFTTVLSIAAIAFLVGLACYLAKKQRLASFCILWFLGNLIIESSVIALEIIFDHRTYLPSMLVCLMAVVILYPRMRPKWLALATLSAVVLFFSFWTYERNTVFRDHIALWGDCAAKSPAKARSHLNLGTAFARQHNYEQALVHFYETLRLRPYFSEAHYRMANALASLGRMDDAMDHYKDALKIKPDDARTHFKLADVLDQKGRHQEAIEHYQEALRHKPGYVQAHNNLGAILASHGRLEEAIGHFTRVMKIRPNDVEPYFNMGNATASLGRYKEAAAYFSKALQINPRYSEAQRNLKKVQRLMEIKQALRSHAGSPQKKSN